MVGIEKRYTRNAINAYEQERKHQPEPVPVVYVIQPVPQKAALVVWMMMMMMIIVAGLTQLAQNDL